MSLLETKIAPYSADRDHFAIAGETIDMADLHPIAKRIHTIQPDPVRLTTDSGVEGTFRFSATEFFKREFRGEGVRIDDDTEADYRLITSEDYQRVLLGRKASDEGRWSMFGEVVAVEAVETVDEAE